jgi:2-iminoacetate synthase
MSFVDDFDAEALASVYRRSLSANAAQARMCLEKADLSLEDFAVLISPAAAGLLEPLCQRAKAMTRRRFGNVIRMFAPIYISNQCVNNCVYCGFARRNDIVRVTLTVDEVRREAQALASQGFRNLLLVASEHPKLVSSEYLAQCVAAIIDLSPAVSLEVAPMSTEDYLPIVKAGADGLTVFQETYDEVLYAPLHPSGPKRDFRWRLGTPERAYAAGFRKLGLGALLGLKDWRMEALCLMAHAQWLLKNCWKAQVSISLPRLRPAASGFIPPAPIPDREFAQFVAATRLLFPDVSLVLSTRESSRLRDGLIPLGITQMSAGSHTEPGGYTGAGREKTVHSQSIANAGFTPDAAHPTDATGQFDVADDRSPIEVAASLRKLGLEPVWKDWDTAFMA